MAAGRQYAELYRLQALRGGAVRIAEGARLSQGATECPRLSPLRSPSPLLELLVQPDAHYQLLLIKRAYSVLQFERIVCWNVTYSQKLIYRMRFWTPTPVSWH